MKLTGKIAIVTGASSGMGKAITTLFAQEGATVVGFARRKERLEELAANLSGAAGKVVPFAGDMSSQESIDALVDFTVKEFGQIDIVVNNAGIMDNMSPIGDVTDEMWDRVIAVNLTAVMQLTRRALGDMLPREKGVFVNISSIGGLNGCRAGAAYTASKWGVLGLTKNTAFMYAAQGIRSNAICPGAINTEIATSMGTLDPFGAQRCTAGVTFNPRSGEPEEIAAAALFLASDDASFVNGVALPVDGGWTSY
jgi:NAD(P)-dependent dehydrogenase (short-subunit alcohol dehydrogenase family)